LIQQQSKETLAQLLSILGIRNDGYPLGKRIQKQMGITSERAQAFVTDLFENLIFEEKVINIDEEDYLARRKKFVTENGEPSLSPRESDNISSDVYTSLNSGEVRGV